MMDILNNYMNLKKGQGLSLTTIVIAALALLILVVLTVIFAGRMGLFSKGLGNCDSVCVDSAAACEDAGYTIPAFLGRCEDSSGTVIKENGYCCHGKQES